jgi:hypothetical protein
MNTIRVALIQRSVCTVWHLCNALANTRQREDEAGAAAIHIPEA